jgi:glutamine cyclotransferase
LLALLPGCGGDDDGQSGATPTTVTTTTAAAPTSAGGVTTADPTTTAPQGLQRLRVEVVARHPHDTDVFTEGLELDADGVLYESSGLYGESSVRVVDRADGEALVEHELAAGEFAEGITIVDDELVILTWKEHTAHRLDATTLEPVGEYTYDTDGWGLCDDGGRFVMSDGTATLRFRDRATFAETGRVEVTMEGQPVTQLNELECVGDDVYANVWLTDTIVRIDPATGAVSAIIDAGGLVPTDERIDDDAVLNGIAYDPAADTFLLTGKWWPTMFEVRFVAA